MAGIHMRALLEGPGLAMRTHLMAMQQRRARCDPLCLLGTFRTWAYHW